MVKFPPSKRIKKVRILSRAPLFSQNLIFSKTMTTIQSDSRRVAFEFHGELVYDQDEYTPGYEKGSVPLGGLRPIYKESCHCETQGDKSCGCAFGQCALGLIF